MSDDLRLHRGLVVHALYAQYPHPLTEVSLVRQVQHLLLEGAALERVLAYLQEKGLVELHVAKVGGRTIRTYRITAAGVDLVEGSTEDPGIDLGLTE